MANFRDLTETFIETIFTWDFFCDFKKIKKNTFKIKLQLNVLNSLLGENDIENKFLDIIKRYPETREVLPILLAVREKFNCILDDDTKNIYDVHELFNKNHNITKDGEEILLNFFRKSGLKEVFKDKHITNLNDYVFGIETGLDSNARKNRTGKLMENLVSGFVKEFCERNNFKYKNQATSKRILKNRNINIKNDKSSRIFDFAIYTGKKVYLIETNFYGGGGSKLKSVAGEFINLYNFLKNQGIKLIWITDGKKGRKTALNPLKEAYEKMDGNIYNINMLKNGILNDIIK